MNAWHESMMSPMWRVCVCGCGWVRVGACVHLCTCALVANALIVGLGIKGQPGRCAEYSKARRGRHNPSTGMTWPAHRDTRLA